MKTVSLTRKCVGYLALALVLLIAADMYYPAVMCALGIGAAEPSERNAGADIVAAARSQSVRQVATCDDRKRPKRHERGAARSPQYRQGNKRGFISLCQFDRGAFQMSMRVFCLPPVVVRAPAADADVSHSR